MRYAIIEGGVVVNVTEGAKMDPSWVSCEPSVGIGHTYASGAFTAPVQPGSEPQADSWLISVGAFYDRFGVYKIPILASSDAVVQAMIRDAQVRWFIDLQRADLPTMLDVLIAKGYPIDKAAILNTPAAPGEAPPAR